MARRLSDSQRYIDAAVRAIRRDRTWPELFQELYGTEPEGLQRQQLSNRLNPARSNPGADMLGFCVERLPELQNMTVKEFFGIGEQSAAPIPDKKALQE